MRRPLALALFLLLALVLAGCSGDDAEPTTAAAATEEGTDASAPEGFAFSGGDVAEGEPIDPLHTCDGARLSPALEWREVPEGTAELALVVEDPDAPGGTFTHWVVYAIPADYTGLERGVPVGPVVSGAISLKQGPNDGDSALPGYTGPCPPGGETHDYVFTLYALDQVTGLDGGATVDELRAAMDGHILGEATLTAPYSRTSR